MDLKSWREMVPCSWTVLHLDFWLSLSPFSLSLKPGKIRDPFSELKMRRETRLQFFVDEVVVLQFELQLFHLILYN